MSQSEKQTRLQQELHQAIEDFREIYSPPEMVEMLGKLLTSAMADKCTDRKIRSSQAYFIQNAGKLISTVLEYHREK